jgi:NAD(P)-dependent dehydrogenase (short-subunit alcohol dehydrogenase family)
MDIKNKVIIITGASEGIGAATAKILAKAGAQVVLAARSDEKIGALAHELNAGAERSAGDSDAKGTQVLAVHTDMREPADIQNLIAKTLEVFGRIDILINNAGQGMYGPVESIDIGKYREVMDLNIYAPLRAMQLVIPIMRKQGGGIILNISSRVSKNYFPNLAAYASTKYALNALSLTARTELASDHIIVSVMHPKMTATNFGKNSFGKHPDFSANQPNAPTNTARPTMEIDTPEAVAERIAELIKSEAPEVEM